MKSKEDDARFPTGASRLGKGHSDRLHRRLALAKIGCSRYFVKGPIPLSWIAVASLLPGKTLIVGLTLWYLSGLNRSRKFKFEYKWTGILGIERHTVSRGLKRLVNSGLIAIDRGPGRAPVITMLDCGSTVNGK